MLLLYIVVSEKGSCKPGQPSSPITPAFAFLLSAGILNNSILIEEMIRLSISRSYEIKTGRES
jgi:hypothetical protein